MTTLLRSIAASILFAANASAGTMVFAPNGSDEPPQRSFHTVFTVEQNGIPTGVDEGFASGVRASFEGMIQGGALQSLTSEFLRYDGSGAEIVQFGDLLLRLQAPAFDNETLTIATTFTRVGGFPIVSGPSLFDVAVPDVWDEPLTAGAVQEISPGSYIIDDVGGPWENPNVVVFDGTVEGNAYRVTLDRYGYFPLSVALAVPEPSTLIGAILCAVLYFLWRRSPCARALRIPRP